MDSALQTVLQTVIQTCLGGHTNREFIALNQFSESDIYERIQRFVRTLEEVCITVCRTVCMTVCMVCRTAGSQHAPPQTATSNRSGKATHIVDTRPAVPRRKQVVRKSYSHRGSEAGHSVQTPTGPEKPRTSWVQSRPSTVDGQ